MKISASLSVSLRRFLSCSLLIPLLSISIPIISTGRVIPVDIELFLSRLLKNAVAPIPVLPIPIIREPVRASRLLSDDIIFFTWFNESELTGGFLKDKVLVRSSVSVGSFLI